MSKNNDHHNKKKFIKKFDDLMTYLDVVKADAKELQRQCVLFDSFDHLNIAMEKMEEAEKQIKAAQSTAAIYLSKTGRL